LVFDIFGAADFAPAAVCLAALVVVARAIMTSLDRFLGFHRVGVPHGFVRYANLCAESEPKR
jgi:hypothetical protein